jgi:hypothetical protein
VVLCDGGGVCGDSHLAGDGAGEEGLAGAGRALEDEAAGDAGAQGGEAVRLLEELHHLLQLLGGEAEQGGVEA